MYTIEVYSPEGNRWYLWRDDVRETELASELQRAARTYPTNRVSKNKGA